MQRSIKNRVITLSINTKVLHATNRLGIKEIKKLNEFKGQKDLLFML